MELTRKDFVAGTAAATLIGTGVCSGAADAQADTDDSNSVPWDKEVDLVVVGSGTVAYGALAAKLFGLDRVLMIEKNTWLGGTTYLAGGNFYIYGSDEWKAFFEEYGDDPLQFFNQVPESRREDFVERMGDKDTPDKFMTYVRAAARQRIPDEEAMYSFIEYGNEWLRWTRETCDIDWGIQAKTCCDYYIPLPESTTCGRAQIAMWNEDHTGGAWGNFVHDKLLAAIESAGVETMVSTTGKKLITNGDGRVVGITVECADGTLMNIKAEKGVLLGTGGFEHNAEMRRKYLPFPLYNAASVSTNTGDGHRMAAEVGADLILMDKSWGLPTFLPGDFDPDAEMLNEEPLCDWSQCRGRPGAIVVNRYGRRFGDEGMCYDAFNRDLGRYGSTGNDLDNIPAIFICDQDYVNHYPIRPYMKLDLGIPEQMFRADTLEEIAEHFGIDKDALLQEVAEFNENAAQGIDPKFGRGDKIFSIVTSGDKTGTRFDELANTCLKPLDTPPFYACFYGPGTCSTCGGVRINKNAQAISVDGTVIDGLYAVGACSGNISGGVYLGSGWTLANGAVMGYVAAKHICGLIED